MKDNFEELPGELQKILLKRVVISVVCVLTFLMLLCYSNNWELVIPFLVLSCLLVVSTWQLICRCTEQRYVVVQGTCTELNRTRLRGRTKSLMIKRGSEFIKITGVQTPIPNLRPGDPVKVFIAENVPVYDSDGCKIICSCMTIIKENL